MNIILMGPPGAGKGTQADKLVNKFGLTQISTGDLFRKALSEQTKYGVIAKYFMQFGHLVPDDFTIDAIINLDIPQDKLVKRLSGRRTCKECGATFHVEFNPPKVEGVCDKCGGELYQREDESEEAVTIRLDTYNKQTKPLIDYYTMKGTIININGDQPMEDVFKSIEKSLEGK